MTALLVALAILLAFLCGVALCGAIVAVQAATAATQGNRAKD